MSKGKGRVPMSVPLMEKEIRRLTMLGQRVEAEANLRWVLLAASIRRSGPLVLTRQEIDELRGQLVAQGVTLRVSEEPDGLRLALEESGKQPRVEQEPAAPLAIPEPTLPWWRRVLRWFRGLWR